VGRFTVHGSRFTVGLLLALLVGCGPADPAKVCLEGVDAAGLQRVVQESDAEAVLVNMWATWCVPCREEFPALVRLEKQYRARALRVVLVSWDMDAETARDYLAKQGVTFRSYLRAGEESDQEFIEIFEPRWTGAFPATFVYDRAGQLRSMQEGKLTYEEFEQMVKDALKT
jgi:thiol-disulfide isomerase/thioredoxin